jgi:hypothetical protein
MVQLASGYGRYGYRKVTALLREEGWRVNHKRIERLWRQEGLKVPQKQPKRIRLWLNDGSCVRLHRPIGGFQPYLHGKPISKVPIASICKSTRHSRCGNKGGIVKLHDGGPIAKNLVVRSIIAHGANH